MGQILQPREGMGSDIEIIYDTNDYSLYRLYRKYEQLSEQLDERLKKIRNRKRAKENNT